MNCKLPCFSFSIKVVVIITGLPQLRREIPAEDVILETSGHGCLHKHNQHRLMTYEDLEGLFYFMGGDSNHYFMQLCCNGQGFTQIQGLGVKIKYIKQALRIWCQTFFKWWTIDQGSQHTAYVWGKPHSVVLRLELSFHARFIKTRTRRKAQCLQIHVKTRKGKYS